MMDRGVCKCFIYEKPPGFGSSLTKSIMRRDIVLLNLYSYETSLQSPFHVAVYEIEPERLIIA